MRNFLLVGTADMLPLQMALARHDELWDEFRYRTTFERTPFLGMSDILLRYSKPELHEGNADSEALVDDTNLVLYPAWHKLPEVRDVIFNLMRRFQGIALGRVIIARLPPGGVISPHADDYGIYATQEGMRFHVAVQGQPGCKFRCGEEEVTMLTGQIWWFNHKQPHSAENLSADDRIHLLIDVRTG